MTGKLIIEVMWIDERTEERRIAQELERNIVGNAGIVFDELWKRITECVEAAKVNKTLDPKPFTNGTSDNRVVAIPGSGERRQCNLSLSQNNKEIRVSGATSLVFGLSQRSDGTVGLRLNSEEISLENAAKVILDPLIFPDLPRLKL